MRRKPGFWVLLSLVALLCLLGYLQYRWIDQLARAEREREQQSLRAAIHRISGAFDVEITRAHFAFGGGFPRRGGPMGGPLGGPMGGPPPGRQGEGNPGARPNWPRRTPQEPEPDEDELLTERAQQWTDLAPYPRLVKDVFLVRGSETLRVTPSGLVPVNGLPDGETNPISAIPSGGWEQRHTRYIVFDGEFIRQDLLPRLAGRHLDLTHYGVRVEAAGKVIYSHNEFSRSQSANVFAFRPECFSSGPMRRDRRGPPWRGDPVSTVFRSNVNCDDAPQAREPGRWKLEAGLIPSAAAGLGEFRTRSMLLGFGVLTVLAAGIGMLGLYWHRAQILAQRQIEFSMAVSHELRTPLTVIRVAADSLADGMVKDPRMYGELIRKETVRLSDMVEQVLVFARTQRADIRPQLEAIPPGAVIDRAIAAVAPAMDRAGLAVNCDVSEATPIVRADANLLSAAVQNLLINASKYAAAGGAVQVTAEPAAPGHVRIVVQDNGPGVRAADLPRVFSAFYRASDAANSSTPGLGLGLHLVKRIVEAHGGSVRAANREGTSGFEVELRLPAIES